MKKYIPWFILLVAIVILAAFLKNLTTPTNPTGFVADIKKCGQMEQLGYCSGPYSCGVRCNSCGCDKPVCNFDETCKQYFETNFKF